MRTYIDRLNAIEEESLAEEESKSIENSDIDFDYDKIMQPNIVIRCDTEEKAKKLLDWAHFSKRLNWNKGGFTTENKDSFLCEKRYYGSKTCYSLYDCSVDKVDYYIWDNCDIFNFEDVIK